MASRIVLIDPSLGRSGGHHAVVAANYAKLLKPTGRPVVFAGNIQAFAADHTVIPAFGYVVEDVFRVTLYGARWLADRRLVQLARAMRPPAALRRAFARGRALPATQAPLDPAQCAELVRSFGAAAALRRLDTQLSLGEADDLVLLAADPALLAALADRAERWLAAHAPRLHVVFMYPEARVLGASTEEGFFSIYRSLLNAARPPRFYAESGLHAADLSARLGADVAELPTPVRIAALPPAAGPWTIGVLGAARADKGFEKLPRIVAAARDLDPGLAFRIQGPPSEAGLDAPARRLRRLPGVTLLAPDLSDEAYEAELARAHVVLLPYDRESFARRGSGVLADALIAGRPAVVTRGTALEDALGAGLLADTPEEFADAIVRIKARNVEFADAAQAGAGRALERLRASPLVGALSLDTH
ncbi:MAG: glycosyltransferase [Hyphomonadaceae bacterium]|nr:glycosyltransferase [Hyphomonadaceae bacterium]